MLGRPDSDGFTTPHLHAASTIRRYLDFLMKLTHDHPVLMNNLVYAAGASSVTLMATPWLFLANMGIELPAIIAASIFGAGLAGTVLSTSSWFAQHKVFGFPVTDNERVFATGNFSHGTAVAEMIYDEKSMPRLEIKSSNNFDAGYVEGYILGAAIRQNLQIAKDLFPLISAAMSLGLKDELTKVFATIPERFQQEMQGKIVGYYAWLNRHYPGEKALSLEFYTLLQLMPDCKNYNPLHSVQLSRIFGLLRSAFASAMPQMGCTTIAMRLGDYTFFNRVLDWPAYGMAGKYFLQIDREIAGSKRTIDIGMPMLSGALTIVNENGVLMEMNVANGEQVTNPQGMPAVFFNRHCAENAGNLRELNELIAREKPLCAYHLTATDGKETQSFHFYQSDEVRGANAIDTLGRNKQEPQLLVVANNGLYFKDNAPVPVNYSDSNERKDNIHQLFHHRPVHDRLTHAIALQANGEPLTKGFIASLQQDICLRLARLAIVNNCESVLCAMYVYHHDQLEHACAAADNLYAQSKPFEEFKQLHSLR